MKKRRVWIKFEVILLFTALSIYAINKIFLIQLTLMWFWLKRPIKDSENILLIYVAGSYWEFIAPLYIAAAVTDLYDIVAYLAGGIIVILLRKYINRWEDKR